VSSPLTRPTDSVLEIGKRPLASPWRPWQRLMPMVQGFILAQRERCG